MQQQQREEDRVLARTLSPLDKALPAKRNSKKARRTGRVQGRLGELLIHVKSEWWKQRSVWVRLYITVMQSTKWTQHNPTQGTKVHFDAQYQKLQSIMAGRSLCGTCHSQCGCAEAGRQCLARDFPLSLLLLFIVSRSPVCAMPIPTVRTGPHSKVSLGMLT